MTPMPPNKRPFYSSIFFVTLSFASLSKGVHSVWARGGTIVSVSDGRDFFSPIKSDKWGRCFRIWIKVRKMIKSIAGTPSLQSVYFWYNILYPVHRKKKHHEGGIKVWKDVMRHRNIQVRASSAPDSESRDISPPVIGSLECKGEFGLNSLIYPYIQ